MNIINSLDASFDIYEKNITSFLYDNLNLIFFFGKLALHLILPKQNARTLSRVRVRLVRSQIEGITLSSGKFPTKMSSTLRFCLLRPHMFLYACLQSLLKYLWGKLPKAANRCNGVFPSLSFSYISLSNLGIHREK